MGWSMVIVVWLLSLVPLSSPMDVGQHSDKMIHLLAYFGMTFWFFHLSDNKWTVVVLFLSMGLVIELLQGLTSYRYFEWADILANTVGVLLAFSAFSVARIQVKFLLTK